MTQFKNILIGLILASIIANCNSEYHFVKTSFIANEQLKHNKTFGILTEVYDGHREVDQALLESLIYKRFIALGYIYVEQNPDMIIGTSYIKLEPKDTTHQISLNSANRQKIQELIDGYLIFTIVNSNGRGVFLAKCFDYKPGESYRNTVSSICRILDQYEMNGYDVAMREF